MARPAAITDDPASDGPEPGRCTCCTPPGIWLRSSCVNLSVFATGTAPELLRIAAAVWPAVVFNGASFQEPGGAERYRHNAGGHLKRRMNSGPKASVIGRISAGRFCTAAGFQRPRQLRAFRQQALEVALPHA